MFHNEIWLDKLLHDFSESTFKIILILVLAEEAEEEEASRNDNRKSVSLEDLGAARQQNNAGQ